MRIATIVVTYNRKELLLECLKHLLDQTFVSDIIVVDNNSSDGTEIAVRELIDEKKIQYLNTGENLGGAGGFQYGIKYATKAGYDYLWIMDDDSMPTSTALEELIVWGKKLRGRFGFLSSKVLWKDGSLCKMNLQAIGLHKKVQDFDAPKTRIKTSTFVSMFFSTKIVRKVGLPIKEFFIWCDDIEYTSRISKRYPCYLITASVVEHHCPTNIGSNIMLDSLDRLDRYRYAYRNEVYYFRHEGIIGISYWAARLLYHMLRVMMVSKDYKMKRLSVMIKASLEGLGFRPSVEYLE